jgi:hypothetical protein
LDSVGWGFWGNDWCDRVKDANQKKQFWNFRYNNRKRLRELLVFLKENKIEDDFQRLNLDLETLK